MVETRSGRRFALFFLAAAFLVLLLGRWLQPVDNIALSVAAPFDGAVSTVASTIGDGVSGVFDGPRLQSENRTIKQQNAILLKRYLALQEQAHENAMLRSMLKFTESNPQIKLLGARVIANDPNSLAPYILINKGSRDGLRAGMTVLDQHGYFLGSISAMASNASRVQLMLSPSSSVGAFDLKTRAQGLVEGQYGSRPAFDNVVTSNVVQKGDLVLTSGQMDLFPRGILLGQVVRVTHRNVDMFQKAIIQPAVDFQDIEMAQVVKNFVPNAPTKLVLNP